MTRHCDKHHKERSTRFVHAREKEAARAWGTTVQVWWEATPAWGTRHHWRPREGPVTTAEALWASRTADHFQPTISTSRGPCLVFMVVVVLLIKLVTNSGFFLVYGMNCLIFFIYAINWLTVKKVIITSFEA